MGTHRSRIPGFLGRLTIFQAYAACICLNMRHVATASVHENHKANTTGTKEETKDASTLVYVMF